MDGKELRSIRLARGETLEVFGRWFGHTAAAQSRYEHGNRRVPARVGEQAGLLQRQHQLKQDRRVTQLAIEQLRASARRDLDGIPNALRSA